MALSKIMFATGKDDWETPDDLFQTYHRQFNFTLDAAADYNNRKVERYYGVGGLREDALTDPWPTDERIWLNPPYSKGLQRKFVDRAVECARAGGFVVALLPARTDTKLFHDLIWQRFEGGSKEWVRRVDFLKGRVKFLSSDGQRLQTNSAPFPSMIVVFGR